ncbi:glycerophosphodiester phosphodiesterase family protein [Vibrio sp. SCSIO 43136]|uniref:glycerophosphodiester phosphodiesterase family protein n=1 Tax=Vibrio sp. SCSIO 43136 TaxID=2819101 RepID=UPI002074DC8D|nr:glycerophosphodiester phosphodiesterase family protein [Vibrio sp. SCSIO 43136]USD66088.1 glycerophosphoryl diester phosphodiesterase [Vibrio sp. SCSIO 43136]
MPLTIVGHRGVAGHYPENTRASILAAIELGLEWVEVDVQPSLDGELVICHDHTVDRCSDGTGRIDEMSLCALKALDMGSWFEPRFASEKMMTLDELLAVASEHQLKLNLEIKVDRHKVEPIIAKLKQALEANNVPAEQVIISSFNHEVIRQVNLHCSNYPIAVLSEKLSAVDWALLDEVKAKACNLNIKHVTGEDIDDLQSKGYMVWCYTVNAPQAIEEFPQLDGIFSDFPARFIR